MKMRFVLLLLFLSACGEGQVGQQGPVGNQGTSGSEGEKGSDGSPGTVIVPIQLCSSTFVPTYPNIFPEIAFKIGTKLYGVYSANGGFMVELTPGSYSSNGINASCSFIVTESGEVTW